MKRIYYVFLIILSLLCNSCMEINNHGYPEKVYFSKHGGEKLYFGKDSYSFISLELNDYNMNHEGECKRTKDTIYITCQWLTIKHPVDSNELIMIAQPNKSKKKRKLYMRGYFFGPDMAETTIIQNK